MQADLSEPEIEVKWKLKFEKQPTLNAFVKEEVNCFILLLDEKNEVIKQKSLKDRNIEVTVKLLIHPNLTQVEAIQKNLTVFNVNKVKIDANGEGKVSFSVNELSSQHNNHSFCLEACLSKNTTLPLKLNNDHLTESVVSIQSTLSDPFKTVSSKLTIPNNTKLPQLWFKDTGGRENCMSLVVGISSLVEFKKIPLKATLVYENGDSAYDPKGNLLTLHQDSVQEITSKHAEAFFKFRIEEVSKNHQSKGFCLKIEASNVSQHADVAPVITSPVIVKSKPNSKRKATKKLTKRQRSINKRQKPVYIDNFQSENINSVKDSILGGDKLSANNMFNWAESVRNVLCNLHELSLKRNSLESKLWSLLNTYPDGSQPVNNVESVSPTRQRERLNSLEVISSGASLPTLSHSTQQLIKGWSSEIPLTNGNSVGMMLNGLKKFAETQKSDSTATIDTQDPNVKGMFQQLIQEYKATK